MSFKPPFRATGFFDPTADDLSYCDLEIESAGYVRDGLQLSPGCMMTIAAFVLPETDNFIIDLIAHQREVAMHMRAKLPDCQLTLNSTAAGKWQSEMRVKNLPLRRGRAFHVSVLVKSKAFLIAFNGEHFAAFPHRLPYDAVNTLAMYKGLKVAAVYYEVDYKYSKVSFGLNPAAAAAASAKVAQSAIYPQLPYSLNLDGKAAFFSTGACLLMTLKPNFASKSATISFAQSDGKAAMDLELFVSHSQGQVRLHAAKGSRDVSLWSLIGLHRRQHTDVCVCCTESALRLYIGQRPVFQATKEQLQSLWGRVTQVTVKGDVDLIVVHFRQL